MPRALAVVWELVRSDEPDAVKKATLLACDEVLGLDIANWAPEELDVPVEVSSLVERREQARSDRDWQLADELREQINELGFSVEDTRDGQQLSKLQAK